MARVDVTCDLAKPPARVQAYLREHEHLAALFGAQVQAISHGPEGRTGVGSVRTMRVRPLPPFDETVTAVEPDRLEYRITRGGPLRHHRGRVHLTPLPHGGTRVHYVIEFGAVVPGLAPLVARTLTRGLRRELPRLDERA